MESSENKDFSIDQQRLIKAGFPAIPPVSEKIRPFWSVMIPTYNSREYLEETLRSVLAQDPGPEKMQIEIVDDCSDTDAALQTMRKLELTNRVGYFRQPHNLGLARNWNTCIERSRGEIVHILHQDDIVLPGFYAAFETPLQSDDQIGASFCRHQSIDQLGNSCWSSRAERPTPGILLGWLERIAAEQCIQTPAIVVRRCVYEKIGGFSPQLSYALDWEMWIRIAANYSIWFEPQILAHYRQHAQNETARLEKLGQNIRDIRKSLSIRRSYLSDKVAKQSELATRKKYAKFAFRRGFDYIRERAFRIGFAQIYEGLKTDISLETLLTLWSLIKKYLVEKIVRFLPFSHKKNG